jgi:hypothetical protein
MISSRMYIKGCAAMCLLMAGVSNVNVTTGIKLKVGPQQTSRSTTNTSVDMATELERLRSYLASQGIDPNTIVQEGRPNNSTRRN